MEHPEHSGAIRTYIDHLYADNLRYVACGTTGRESFQQWQAQARPVLCHLLGLESIGASLGNPHHSGATRRSAGQGHLHIATRDHHH